MFSAQCKSHVSTVSVTLDYCNFVSLLSQIGLYCASQWDTILIFILLLSMKCAVYAVDAFFHTRRERVRKLPVKVNGATPKPLQKHEILWIRLHQSGKTMIPMWTYLVVKHA